MTGTEIDPYKTQRRITLSSAHFQASDAVVSSEEQYRVWIASRLFDAGFVFVASEPSFVHGHPNLRAPWQMLGEPDGSSVTYIQTIDPR